MKKTIFTCVALALAASVAIAGGKKKADGMPPMKDRILLFNSGFEDSVVCSSNPEGNDYLTGADKSVKGPNDWTKLNKGEYPVITKFYIAYEGGDPSERFSAIVPDPVNPKNKVLTFKSIRPNVGKDKYKSRIQAGIVSPKGEMPDICQSVRLYLHPDMEFLKSMPEKFGHLILFEWWNNSPGKDKSYISRTSLRIFKPEANKPGVFLKVDSQNIDYAPAGEKGQSRTGARFFDRWSVVNTEFEIPYGKWMTVEYYIKEGDEKTGRFFMAITPDGGKRQVIFDVTGETYGHGNPEPPGFMSFAPMKLYTSKNITNYMTNNGKSLQVYWDDFKVWKTKGEEAKK